MRGQIGHLFAAACRSAPFERGRWRLGAAAYRHLNAAQIASSHVISTRHGFDMSVDLRQFVDRTIYCMGEWEPHESALIQKLLKPGDCFVDVGANIGYFSLLAAKLVGPEGKVFAFEANARTHALLLENLARNDARQVAPQWLAVGEQSGHAIIHHYEPGNAGGDVARLADGGDTKNRVRMERLDEVLAGTPIALIKLDIEGGEAKALRGASGLLDGDHAPDLLFELTPRLLEDSGDNAEDLLNWLRDRQYHLTKIASHAGGLTSGSQGQSYFHATKRAVR